MRNDLIDYLAHRLKRPLPGRKAQYSMAHVVRRSRQSPPDDAKQAGVLSLFYPKQGDWYLVLIERMSNNLQDRHRGQISFPGGKREKEDDSLLQTALREAEEEVGVPSRLVKPLGKLTELYIPVSNFLVQPFVGFTEKTPSFSPEPLEVKSIIEVPLSLLLDPKTVKTTSIRLTDNMTLQHVPYYDVYGNVVWGATAMMLSELLEIIAESDIDRLSEL